MHSTSQTPLMKERRLLDEGVPKSDNHLGHPQAPGRTWPRREMTLNPLS